MGRKVGLGHFYFDVLNLDVFICKYFGIRDGPEPYILVG